MKSKWVASLQWLVRYRKGRQRFGWSLSALAGLAVLAAFLPRSGQSKASANTSGEMAALPSVAVAPVVREDLFQEVTIPAEFRPYTEVELHAKVSGYLQQINVDFGDQVKAGQLLATLEVPELQDQLHNAMAAEQKAEADYKNAHLAYTRLLTVNQGHPQLVAQQDIDVAEAKDSTAAAAIAGAKAEVEKFQTLAAYTKITAPFDGVVTRRYADPGALIQAGTASDTQSLPLVRLSDNYRLRLDFPVSVDYVPDITLGDSAEVRVESLAGNCFTGKISRFTHKVDEATRTMIVEMEIENPKLALVPGMYATVDLKVRRHPGVLAVPIEAVSAGKKSAVCVVGADHEIEERTVTLGLETPTQYEVLSGLQEGELVPIGNPSQVKPGEKVETKLVSCSHMNEPLAPERLKASRRLDASTLASASETFHERPRITALIDYTVRILEIGAPVKIGGLKMKSGDLLHGDLHGIQSAPLDFADRIPQVAARITAKEHALIALCRSPGFTTDKLRSVVGQRLN